MNKTIIRARVAAVIFAAIALALALSTMAMIFSASNRPERAYAASFCPDDCRPAGGPADPEMFATPQLVIFYETNISNEKVVSQYTQEELDAMAQKYGVPMPRLISALLINDLSKRNGSEIPIEEIAVMNKRRLMRTVKSEYETYEASLSEEEKLELKAKFKEFLENGFGQ